MAHRLVQKGWLQRVRPGLFQLVPAERGPEGVSDTNPLTIGPLLVDPYFFSFGTACTHYGFTEQVFAEVYIACRTPKRPVTVRGTRYVFAPVPEQRFFGFEEVEVLGSRRMNSCAHDVARAASMLVALFNVEMRVTAWLRRRGLLRHEEVDAADDTASRSALDACLEGSLGLGELTALPAKHAPPVGARDMRPGGGLLITQRDIPGRTSHPSHDPIRIFSLC